MGCVWEGVEEIRLDLFYLEDRLIEIFSRNEVFVYSALIRYEINQNTITYPVFIL